jgi:hypothetical protein
MPDADYGTDAVEVGPGSLDQVSFAFLDGSLIVSVEHRSSGGLSPLKAYIR